MAIISTRGRYALRVMIDLALNQGDEYIPMKEVAARQGVSLKYLEQILPVLSKNKYIEGVHGKGGGYRLCKAPEEYRIGDILRLTEGNLKTVECLGDEAAACDRKESCRTFKFWKGLDDAMENYIDSYTLADLIK